MSWRGIPPNSQEWGRVEWGYLLLLQIKKIFFFAIEYISFLQIKTKKNYLPFLQIKKNIFFCSKAIFYSYKSRRVFFYPIERQEEGYYHKNS